MSEEDPPSAGEGDEPAESAMPAMLLSRHYARSKRRIALLEDQLESLKTQGTKEKSEAQSMAHQGRAICRLVVLFDSVENLVKEHDRRLDLDESAADDSVNERPAEDTEEEERRYRAYNQLIHYLPIVKRKVNALDSSYELDIMYKALRKGSDGARGDDTSVLKKSVVTWISQLFGVRIPPLELEIKSNRGFDHIDTGRLLCPSEFGWENEDVQQKIRNGDPDFMVTAFSWPNFLYDGYKCDPFNLEKGLFRSAILLKAFKAIFTSPSSARSVQAANDENQPPPPKRAKAVTRQHVAAIIGMTAVTGRSIAYVASQLRFALSNLNSWTVLDGDFSCADFYSNIVDYFERTPGPRAKESVDNLLKWWTGEIFGRRPAAARAPTHQGATVNRLAAQRASREAAGAGL